MAKAHKTVQKTEHKIEHNEHKVEHHGHKLEPKRLGFAFGALKGISLGVLALLAWTLGWGRPLVNIAGSVFLGYEASPPGIFFGLLWGFVFGFIGGYLFALVYNKAEKCC